MDDEIKRVIDDLLHRIEILEEKRIKHAKQNMSELVKLQEFKETFIQSKPETRIDPFTNEELVLWFTYIKMIGKKDTERITSFSELYKRVAKIKLVYSHFEEIWNSNFVINGISEQREDWIRGKIKQYLEYMIMAQNLPENKQNNFYIVCSQWALNEYAHKISAWQSLKNVEDKPYVD